MVYWYFADDSGVIKEVVMKRYPVFILLFLLLGLTSLATEIIMLHIGREEVKIPLPEGYRVLPEEYIQQLPLLRLYQGNTDGLLALLVPLNIVTEFEAGRVPELERFIVVGSPEYFSDKYLTVEDFGRITRRFSEALGTEKLDEELKAKLLAAGARSDKAISVRSEKVHSSDPGQVKGILEASCYLPGIASEYHEVKAVAAVSAGEKLFFINTVSLQSDIEWAKTAAEEFEQGIMEANSN